MENLEQHYLYMRRCLELAKKAKERGESPVGSLVVMNGEIIGEGIEGVKFHNDLTFHSEIEAIRRASEHLGHRNLKECTLYTTHEPCIMCSYVIRQTKIPTVVVGISCGEIGGYSSDFPILTDDTIRIWNFPPTLITGIMEKEILELMEE